MTDPVHARLADWDAAYVVGALSPADRRQFEDHLGECERCREAVAELGALPGLLGRLDDARGMALLDDDASAGLTNDLTGTGTGTGTDAVVSAIRGLERRRRIRTALAGVGALAAAAALASALTLAIPAALAPHPQVDAAVTLHAVAGQTLPIEMTVSATRADWGTRLDVRCAYRSTPAAYGPVAYSLWVVGSDGAESAVSTWRSTPGAEVRLDAATALALDDIARLQLRSADGGQTLMEAPLP
jgi:anti-sigma factor RsiW